MNDSVLQKKRRQIFISFSTPMNITKPLFSEGREGQDKAK